MSSHNPGRARYLRMRYPERLAAAPPPAEIIDETDEIPRDELALNGVYKVVDIRTARQVLKGSVQQLFSGGEEHVAPRAEGTPVPEVHFKTPSIEG